MGNKTGLAFVGGLGACAPPYERQDGTTWASSEGFPLFTRPSSTVKVWQYVGQYRMHRKFHAGQFGLPAAEDNGDIMESDVSFSDIVPAPDHPKFLCNSNIQAPGFK